MQNFKSGVDIQNSTNKSGLVLQVYIVFSICMLMLMASLINIFKCLGYMTDLSKIANI